jgi:hypothetical protein
VLAAAGLLLAAGCGGEGGLSNAAPRPSSASDAAADTAPDVSADVATPPKDAPVETGVDAGADTTAPPADAGPVKRTVVTRDPYGNYAKTDNLLLDGDLEWSGSFTSQYPWLQISGLVSSWRAPSTVAGARCRSGVKCASLAANTSAMGFGVRPPSGDLAVSLWVKPVGTDCTKTSVSVGACFALYGLSSAVPYESGSAGADGWCHAAGVVAAPDAAPCLFVSNDGDEDGVLFDDAVMEAAPSPAPGASGATKAFVAPSARHGAVVAKLREAARDFASPKPPAWLAPPKLRVGKLR